MTVLYKNRGMLKKSDRIFSRLAANGCFPISVTVEPEDQYGTQRLALYPSGVQQQEVDYIYFFVGNCFYLIWPRGTGVKSLARYRKKTVERLAVCETCHMH